MTSRPVPSYTQMYTARLRNEMITRVFRSIKRSQSLFPPRHDIRARPLASEDGTLSNAFSQQYAGARIELGMRSTEQLVWEVCSRPICLDTPARAAGAEVPSASAPHGVTDRRPVHREGRRREGASVDTLSCTGPGFGFVVKNREKSGSARRIRVVDAKDRSARNLPRLVSTGGGCVSRLRARRARCRMRASPSRRAPRRSRLTGSGPRTTPTYSE